MTDDIIAPPHKPNYIDTLDLHNHKFFLFQVKKDFEPLPDTPNSGLYLMKEYGYLSCNCGEVVKSAVRNKN